MNTDVPGRRTLAATIVWLRTPAPLAASARQMSRRNACAIVALVAVAYLGWPTVTAVYTMGRPPASPSTTWWAVLADMLPELGILLATVPSFGLLVHWLRAGRRAAGLPRQASPGPAKASYYTGFGLMLATTFVYGLLTGSHAGEMPMPGWPAVVAQISGALVYSPIIEELAVVAVPALALTHARIPRWAIIVTAMLLRGPYHLYHGWYALVWAAVWSGGLMILFLIFRRLLPLIGAHIASNTFILGVTLGPPLVPLSALYAVTAVVLVPLAIWHVMSRRAPPHVHDPDTLRASPARTLPRGSRAR